MAPLVFENFPEVQYLQSFTSNIPCMSLYLPAGHFKQLILYSSEYKPTSQSEHSVLFSFDTQPLGQIKHLLEEY